MKNYVYGVGVLALVMSCAPAVAFAEDEAADVASTTVVAPRAVRAEIGVRAGTSTENIRNVLEEQRLLRERALREEQKILREHALRIASSTEVKRGEFATSTARMIPSPRFILGSTTPVRNIEQLKQVLEERKQEIKAKLASTTPKDREAFERASRVSVAAHALVASRDILGGNVGQQISQIAQSVNNSLATTTVAEAKIKSRSFFTKLLFGGDAKSAEEIKQQVEQNQERIQELTKLLSTASTTEEVRAALKEQVQSMKDEQARLHTVAQSQSKLWGLFSWRF